MKPRHAAALALVAWYLMVPPSQHTVFGCDPTASLTKWLKFSSFGSETACRDRLDQMQGEEKNDPEFAKSLASCAEAYVNAAGRAGLSRAAVSDPIHFCLSAAIAAPLLAAGAAKVRVAAEPDEATLLALCP